MDSRVAVVVLVEVTSVRPFAEKQTVQCVQRNNILEGKLFTSVALPRTQRWAPGWPCLALAAAPNGPVFRSGLAKRLGRQGTLN